VNSTERRTRGPAKPKPAIIVAALTVSTENCLSVAGLPPRKFRQALAAHPDIPRSRIGTTLIVTTEHFRELLARLASESSEEHAGEEDGDDILARAGLTRVAGRR
jgi:hypothetical protein